ncbi:glycoside hydrolase family 5 protein [Candidatus Nomurabacteria bacterium]|nr:glycoside hydrolase family 5 protein [Candidatus Nomurabacteria bacterium]
MNTAIPAIAAAGANTVRLVLNNGTSPDFGYHKSTAENVRNALAKCEENELIAVLEVHDATGKNDTASLVNATNYWIEIKDELIGKEDKVIINIANEWYASTTNLSVWRNAYITAVTSLRNAGLEHVLMIDAAGWGQYSQSIRDHGAAILNSDPLGNTMFSIHMYENSGGSSAAVMSNIDMVLGQGLALAIGEFGYYHNGYPVAYQTIMDYCEQKGVGWLAWSWKGNSGGVEYLDLALEWDGSVLSSNWGDKVVNGTNGLKDTSVRCSVFE